MANQLPDHYWTSLGEGGVFLRTLLNTQTELVNQLQLQNQHYQNQLANLPNNLAEVATAAAAAAAATHNTSYSKSPSTRPIKAAEPGKFSGDRAETEGFIRSIKIAIAIQPESFPDERTKIMYALSFMTGGSAEVWAHNETQAVIDGTTSLSTFEEFIKQVENAFGDPDRSRTARTKLHDLRMTPGMSADEYTAQFEILAGRTGFNDAALEDAYARGLPAMILDKIHAQPLLPLDLKAWKEAACQIDRNHRRLIEVRRAQTPHTSSRSVPSRAHNTPVITAPTMPSLSTGPIPMDIDSSRRRIETQTCYNCGKRGHISPACPEPRKERIRAELTQAAIVSMINESVAAALDSKDAAQEEKQGFQASQR